MLNAAPEFGQITKIQPHDQSFFKKTYQGKTDVQYTVHYKVHNFMSFRHVGICKSINTVKIM